MWTDLVAFFFAQAAGPAALLAPKWPAHFGLLAGSAAQDKMIECAQVDIAMHKRCLRFWE